MKHGFVGIVLERVQHIETDPLRVDHFVPLDIVDLDKGCGAIRARTLYPPSLRRVDGNDQRASPFIPLEGVEVDVLVVEQVCEARKLALIGDLDGRRP